MRIVRHLLVEKLELFIKLPKLPHKMLTMKNQFLHSPKCLQHCISKRYFMPKWLLLIIFFQTSFNGFSQCVNVNINTAFNFIVDSNIESPAGVNPETAYLTAEVCNHTGATVNDLFVNIGDHTTGTPGDYPGPITWPGLTGSFELKHVADVSDATRFVGTLEDGECRSFYWMVSYPFLDDAGDAVFGVNSDPSDDLELSFDVWANHSGCADVSSSHTVFFRNEITASANKIWPNGDNKVPSEYVAAMQAEGIGLGWSTEGNIPAAGETTQLEGVWYDMGVVGQGFDNDGDLVPDYNCWMQPVGNPALFDPNCFLLAHTYGILIVKTQTGDVLIPFEDELYFTNIPKNQGVVGLVFYDYIAADGACVGSLTPYQEAASGFDNEKFNADYGTTIPIVSDETDMTLEKTVDQTSIDFLPDPATLTYTLAFSNGGTANVGMPEYGLPLVVQDKVPAGTAYVPGSAAAAANELPLGSAYPYRIVYSADGITWSATETTPVVYIQWWLNEALAPTMGGKVQFQVTVPSTIGGSLIENVGGLGLGNHAPFLEDDAITFLPGTNTIGDLVWLDNGGTNGIPSNGLPDGDEAGIAGVEVLLYYDVNDDGIVDDGDILWDSMTTLTDGSYAFTDLPDGDYLVLVDDTNVPTGNTSTTPILYSVSLAGSDFLGADFGFAPALVLSKTLTSESPAYEGHYVTYDIAISNLLPLDPAAFNPYANVIWSTGHISPALATSVTNIGNSFEDDGLVATSTDWPRIGGGIPPAEETMVLNSFAGLTFPDCGTIDSVLAVFDFEITGDVADDQVGITVLTSGVEHVLQYISVAELNANYSPASGYYTLNVSAFVTSFADLATLELGIWGEANGGGGNPYDGIDLLVDGIGLQVYTSDCGGGSPFDPMTTLSPVPLIDDYDPCMLTYLSASQEPTSIDETTGLLSWDDVGQIHAGNTQTISVTFVAKDPTSCAANPTTNSASTTNATFANGQAANDATDNADVPVNPTGSIGDFVYNSNTGLGIPNVEIQLVADVDLWIDGVFYSAGTPMLTTTDESGNYLFDGLLDGNYTVTVNTATIPGTVSQTNDPDSACPGAACDDATNVTIAASNDVDTADFGYDVPNAITGEVWEDSNGDGLQDTNEPPLEGVTVYLDNGACVIGIDCPSTTTNPDGSYAFVDLPDGTYTILVDNGSTPLGADWENTADPEGMPGDNASAPITLAGGQISSDNDFGYQEVGPYSIDGVVYYDWNGDGMQGTNEEGFPNGTPVYLYDNQGVVIDTAYTIDGAYTFTNLPNGDYLVEVGAPQYNQTEDPDEAATVCSACDNAGAVTINGAAVTDVDFGYEPTAGGTIGDLVWYDANGDGLQAGVLETGYAQVLVYLYSDFNSDGIFSLVDSVWTDANGQYEFTDLPDGDYQVRVADPMNIISEDLQATTPAIYDASIVNSITDNTSSNCVDCPDSFDFGFAPLGAVGDMVYWDSNGNGQQDFNEIGIAGIMVQLCPPAGMDIDGDGPLAIDECTTTTTSDGTDGNPVGYYQFDNLPVPSDPMTEYYTISVLTPPGTQTADPDSDGLTCEQVAHTDPNINLGYSLCDNDDEVYGIGYGASYTGGDFGYQPPTAIGDYVWIDANGDGVQDPSELGIPNATVALCPSAGVDLGNGVGVCITTTTDVEGHYSFTFDTTLPDGDYSITVTPPAGYINLSDPDGTVDSTTDFTLNGGNVLNADNAWCTGADEPCNLGFDFGYGTGSEAIGGTICIDDGSGNGSCEGAAGEINLEGMEVSLYECTDAPTCANLQLVGSTTTDVNGDYLFDNLANGTYIVVLGTEQGFLNTSSITTNGDEIPGTFDANTYATSDTWTVLSNSTNVDFAYVLPALDYGDLPASYNVLVLEDGPRHFEDTNLKIGTIWDKEQDGAASADATGDGADEDGVDFVTAIHPMGPADWTTGANGGSIETTITGNGYLTGWIDFGKDGSFAGDMIFNIPVTSTNFAPQVIQFDIPADADLCSPIYARFRLFAENQPFPSFSYVGLPTGIQTGEVEDYLIPLAPCTPLDVECVSFTGKAQSEQVELTWMTAQEFENEGFFIERSTDGRNFTTLDFIKGKGTSSEPQSYVYTDEAPSIKLGGTFYYRLRQLDRDGEEHYACAIIAVRVDNEKDVMLNLYPNPSNTTVNLSIYSAKYQEDVTITLHDALGREVRKKEVGLSYGNQTITLGVNDLVPGIYILHCTNGKDIDIAQSLVIMR